MSAEGATLADRVCLVTSASSGIGEETALALARTGARVALLCRDRGRGEAAQRRIRSETGNARVDLVRIDLASLASVRKAAEEIRAAYPMIHLLVNNAGVVSLKRTTSVDGYEQVFAVNHLAPFLLTNLLLERLRQAGSARIVTVSSGAHRFAELDFDDLQSEKRYGWMRVYGASKLANILFTRELARGLEGSGVTANCLHPGAVATRLGHDNGRFARTLTSLLRPFFLTPAQGARTSIYVCTAPELADVNGRYFEKCRPATPSRAARDDDDARRLWQISATLTGLDAQA